MNRYLILLIFLISSIFGETIHRGKVVEANNSMVVTRHFLATEIGNNVLQNGGNAIDASIAISFALAVVLPQAGNIGGGVLWLYIIKILISRLIIGSKRPYKLQKKCLLLMDRMILN